MFIRSYSLSLLSVFIHTSVYTLQSLIVPSSLLLAKIFPIGLKATDHTQLLCPCKVLKHRQFMVYHILTVWLWLPLAIILPSGLKTTDLTQLVWPCRILRHSPVLISQSRMV